MHNNKQQPASKAGYQVGKLLLLGIFSGFVLAGCATTQGDGDGMAKVGVVQLLSQANDELARGKREPALALLNRAAKENPTSVAPWLKIANIWFDAGNYPSAILAANEVLEREAGNQEAKSILVVAGLRVAATAVQGLVSQYSVSSNARTEAENLTKALRLALGEKILVPATATAEQAPAPRSRSRARAQVVRAKTEAAPVASAKAGTVTVQATAQPKVSVSADPFKSLK